MFDALRKLFGSKAATGAQKASELDEERFIYVMIPGDIQPLARGERFEDPLEDALREAGIGTISGGGSQLDDPYPDGRPRVAFCGLDVDVRNLEAGRQLIMQRMKTLGAPVGTELHYTIGAKKLLDRFSGDRWEEGLPRTMLHPGFGV